MTEQDQPPDGAQQLLRFSTADFATPEAALARFRELTTPICGVTVLGDLRDFHASSTTLHLSGALLLESKSSAMRYDRTAAHVALGMDHFQLVMYLGGGAEFVAQDRIYLQRAGDVALLDMRHPCQTREIQAEDGFVRCVCFMLPRLLLEPLLTTQEERPAIRILAHETAYGRMLGDYMLAVRRNAAELTRRESQAAVQSLAQLVAGGVGSDSIGDNGQIASQSQEDLRARVRLYIETNLTSASLGVESLCREFDLSRTGLYRLLAPRSPMNYIQQRRLQRAFAMLISPAFRTWRIIDIALECQFSSDATLNRAFRREFDLSPGEARKLAEKKIPGAPPGSGRPEPQPDAEASRWISQLTGTVLIGANL